MGLFDTLTRVGSGIRNAANTAAERMMPTPVGMDGLLSDDDVQRARRQGLITMGATMLGDSAAQAPGQFTPSFGEALGHGILAGQGAYTGTTKDIRDARVAGMQLAQQQRILAGRSQMDDVLTPRPDETPEDRFNRLFNAYTTYLQHGDFEGAKSVEPLLQNAPMFAKRSLISVDTGGKKVLVDERTGLPVSSYDVGLSPKDQFDIALRREGLGLQRDEFGHRITEDRFSNGQKLAGDFHTLTGDDAKMAATYSTLQGLYPRALNGDPAAAQSYLLAYLHMVNPSQRVPASLVGDFVAGRPLTQKMQAEWGHLFGTGSKFTPNQLVRLNENVKAMAAQSRTHSRNLYGQYGSQMQALGLDPSSSIVDPWGAIPDESAPTTGAGNSNNVRRYVNP